MARMPVRDSGDWVFAMRRLPVRFHETEQDDARSRWMVALATRRGKNIACVAVANKNARILCDEERVLQDAST